MAQSDESLMGGVAPASLESWRKGVDKVLKGGSFEKLVTKTLEGIEVQPLYTQADWDGSEDRAGYAGLAPYRRGTLAVGRAGAHWDQRIKLEHPDPAVTRAELAAEQARGFRSVWLKLDRAARTGRAPAPSDCEALRTDGISCVNAAQLGMQLEGLVLERTGVSLDAGGNALAAAACLLAVAHARGIAPAQLHGLLNADPLSALASDGALPCSLASAGEQLGALGVWANAHAPSLRAVTVSTAPYHDAGATAVQELGYALATGVSYLRLLTAAGLSVSEAARQIAFSVPVASDLFMEVGKLRALRQCWAEVVAACGGDADAQRAVVHAFSSSRTKTQRDPWVNMLRETTEAFAAAIGGADAITTGGFDRTVGASDDFARRIASNVQMILDEEAHVTQVADPAGGSYYVETLTDALCTRGWTLFQELEAQGGMTQALTSGTVAAALAASHEQRTGYLRKRKQAITGVSEFAHVAEERVLRSAPDWSAVDKARAVALEQGAQDAAVTGPLVATRAAGLANKQAALACVQAAIDAAAKGASVEQISRALAGPQVAASLDALPLRRDAAVFEALRDTADAIEQRTGKRPSVFLANLGPIPQHKARSQFASGFFAAGGFSTVDNDGFESPAAAAEAFAASGAKLAVLCGSDEAYAGWVAELAPLLARAGARRIALAGRPATSELESAQRASGVTDYIFMGADVVKALEPMLAVVS